MAFENTTSSPDEQPPLVQITKTGLASSCTLFMTILCVGLVCNSLVLSTILRTPLLRRSSINRAVLSLCMADLITAVVDVPMTMAILLLNYHDDRKWSETWVCDAQSFSHTLAASVQVMSFPCIAIERYFSIRQPFATDKHLLRVNCLCAFIWLAALGMSAATVVLFPTTTISIYCNVTPLEPMEVRTLFHKIYYLTMPLGGFCVLLTVLFYILIVCRVRYQSGPTFSSFGVFFSQGSNSDSPGSQSHLTLKERVEAKRRCVSTTAAPTSVVYKDQVLQVRERSYDGGSSDLLTETIELPTFSESRDSPPTIPAAALAPCFTTASARRASLRQRRVSLPAASAAARRPVLRKAEAICLEEDEEQQPCPISTISGKDQNTAPNQLQLLALPTKRPGPGPLKLQNRSSSLSSYASDCSAEAVSSCTASFDLEDSDPADASTADIAAGVNHLEEDSGHKSPIRKVPVRPQLSAPIIAITMHRDSSRDTDTPIIEEEVPDLDDNSAPATPTSPASPTSTLSPTTPTSPQGLAPNSVTFNASNLAPGGFGTYLLQDDDNHLMIYHHRKRKSIALNMSKGPLSIKEKKAREFGKRRSEAKTAKKSSYIVLIFLALWLPLPVAIGFSNSYVNKHTNLEHLQWHLDLQLAAFCIGMLTTASNPIVYGLAIKSFRVTFKKLVTKDWKWLKDQLSHRSDYFHKLFKAD